MLASPPKSAPGKKRGAAEAGRGFPQDRKVAGPPIGFEETDRFFLLDRLKSSSKPQIVNANPVVRAQRMIKSPAELALMQAANDIMLASLRYAGTRTREGMTPADINAMIAAAQEKLGGLYDPGLVLIGEASAYPHGSKLPHVVKRGDMVLMDCTCSVHGYQADITRTFVYGADPTPSSANYGTRSTRDNRSPSPRPRSACPLGTSMMRCDASTKAGGTARATSCPAPRTAPATASAWRSMSRSIWSTAK